MNSFVMDEASAETVEHGLGRRGFVKAAVTLSAVSALATAGSAVTATTASASVAKGPRTRFPGQILQPGKGPIEGDHYLPSRLDEVLWGYLPRAQDAAALIMSSGRTVTIDTVSHEGLLEDQGRDPLAWFASKGVPREHVLTDGVEIAKSYRRHVRSFDADGPHVVTGPIFVKGAEPRRRTQDRTAVRAATCPLWGHFQQARKGSASGVLRHDCRRYHRCRSHAHDT